MSGQSRKLIDLSGHYPPIPEYVKIYHVAGFGHIINYNINGKIYLSAKTKDFCKICGFDDETTMMWVLKFGPMLPEDVKQL